MIKCREAEMEEGESLWGILEIPREGQKRRTEEELAFYKKYSNKKTL